MAAKSVTVGNIKSGNTDWKYSLEYRLEEFPGVEGVGVLNKPGICFFR